MDFSVQTVPIYMVQQMISRLPGDNDFAKQCANQVGITEVLLKQKSTRVTVQQFSEFYRLLVLGLNDETPGFFSRPLRGGTLKFLCLGMLDAANLRVALYRFCRFLSLMQDDLSFRVKAYSKHVIVYIEELVDLGPERVLILELMLLLIQGIACWVVDRKLNLSGVKLAYERPVHGSEYINMYAGESVFNQGNCALLFRADDMGLGLRQDRESLSEFLQQAPKDWIRPAVSNMFYTHQVRDYLSANLNLSLAEISQYMHLSPRTLARRLATENTKFQLIKNDLRRDLAITRLLRTDDSIASIGMDLGFDDPAVFNRAFKLWLGIPPGAYRKLRF